MKRNYSLRLLPLFILVGLLQLTASSSQAQTPSLVWQHCYGGDSSDEFTCIKPTPDGGFIAAGDTHSSDGDLSANGGIKGLWVVKMDAAGNVQWERTYNDTLAGANYIEQTYDGGYIAIGDQTLKLDAVGNIQWISPSFGSVIHQTRDTGYILVNNFSLVKLNVAGSMQWQQHYANASLYDVSPAVDGRGYIITGTVNDIFVNPFIAYANDSGVSVINYPYGTGIGMQVCPTTNGQYLYLSSLDEGRANPRFIVQKLDTSLNVLWQAGPFYGTGNFCIASTNDNGLITWSAVSDNNEMTLTKFDSGGNQQWLRQIAGSKGDITAFVVQAANGEYAVAGAVYTDDSEISGIHGGEDAWAALLGDNTGVPPVKNETDVKIYPVPATNAVYVDMPEGYNNASLSLSDISGNIVAADNNTSLHRSIDLSHLATGTYLLTVTNNGARSSYKVTHY